MTNIKIRNETSSDYSQKLSILDACFGFINVSSGISDPTSTK